MQFEAIDERDTTWETNTPILRAYFWTRGGTQLDCIDVRDATVLQVIAWAEGETLARDARLELAIRVNNDSGAPGLVWVIGDGRGGRF